MGSVEPNIGFQLWAVIPEALWCSWPQQLMTIPILKLFNLFSWGCSIFDLLIKCTLDHFLSIVTKGKLVGYHPMKTAWQSLMCFTSGCHWEGSNPSKVCDIYLYTSLAPSRHCAGKYHDQKHRICQTTIINVSIFVLNCLDNEGRSIVWISLFVVAWIVFWVFCKVMPHHWTKTEGITDGFLTMPISTMSSLIWADNTGARLPSSMTLLYMLHCRYTIGALVLRVHREGKEWCRE